MQLDGPHMAYNSVASVQAECFPALAAHGEPWRAALGSSSHLVTCQSPRSKGHGLEACNYAAQGTGACPWRPLECDSFLHSFFSSINKVNRKGFSSPPELASPG